MPKRIGRFSAAAPSAQCIESPRRPTNYQQPAKSRSSTRSFPTNNAHQVAHNSPKGDNHTHRGEAPPINQPTNQSTTSPRQSLRLRPPKTKSPPAGHPLFYYTDCQQRPPGHLPESALAAASAPCTRPQIFNQRPDRFTAVYCYDQPSTRTRRRTRWPFRLNIRRRKHCYCCCRHSTSVLPIPIYQSHSPRETKWWRRRRRSGGAEELKN